MSDPNNTSLPQPTGDPSPFQLTCTPAVPELLGHLECTLAVSTYQAGKLVFIGAQSDERLIQLPRTFARPMAIGVRGDELAISTTTTVELFVADDRMAPAYPRQTNTYDTMYLPRRTWRTGHIDAHGLNWDADGNLWVVNTRFGCLAKLSDGYSFEPVWRPPFVSDVVPEDRCHLNGVAFQDDQPKFATCLSVTNEKAGWRANLPNDGVLLDVPTSETILTGLAMPHTPTLVNGTLYVLLSATGDLARVDVASGKLDVVQRVGGFVRGMDYYRSHLFIAYSKLRKNSSTFRDLPIADTANEAGIAIVHEPTGTLVGRIQYLQSVDEIFDVKVLGGRKRPGIVGLDRAEAGMGVTTPEKSWWVTPEKPKDQAATERS